MAKDYVLRAEPRAYEICGSEAGGILGAGYTGREIDVEKGHALARQWLESHETSREGSVCRSDRNSRPTPRLTAEGAELRGVSHPRNKDDGDVGGYGLAGAALRRPWAGPAGPLPLRILGAIVCAQA